MLTIHRDTLLARSEVDEPRSRLAVVVVSSFVYQLVPTNHITVNISSYLHGDFAQLYPEKAQP